MSAAPFVSSEVTAGLQSVTASDSLRASVAVSTPAVSMTNTRSIAGAAHSGGRGHHVTAYIGSAEAATLSPAAAAPTKQAAYVMLEESA
jgi:hypothetical protein